VPSDLNAGAGFLDGPDASTGGGPLFFCTKGLREANVDDQSTRAQTAFDEASQEQRTRAQLVSAKARCLHARLYDDAEEAELSHA
jgi:hypothetical protein